MKIKYLVTVIYCVAGGKLLLAQDTVVTDKKEGAKKLHEVVISAEKDNNFGITRLKQVEGTSIYAGKKSEVIVIGDVNGNTATNNSREIYSKVSGLNIWESDGAGIQLGIGGRGLNPNRVTNFNTRQNGYDISADALGYPESYYAPPTEALERIEIVRGAASLQYGTQFGGFVNFKFKQGPENKSIEATARQTIGSFGFYNAFTSLGGTVKKLNYYTFYQYKKGDSWRPNSHFDVHTAFAGLNYQATKKASMRFNIGQAYRFPSFAERFVNERLGNSDIHIPVTIYHPIRDTFYTTETDSVVPRSTLAILPNTNLVPEYGWTTEFGYQQKLSSRNNVYHGLIDIAFFWQQYKNLVDFNVNLSDTSVSSYVKLRAENISTARIAGIDMSFKHQVAYKKHAVNITTGYTYSLPIEMDKYLGYNLNKVGP